MEIEFSDNFEYLVVPESVMSTVPQYSPVRIAGRWSFTNDGYRLIATRLEWIECITGVMRSFRLAKIGRKARCRYCGRQLNPDEPWGINAGWVPECGDCSDFRDGRDPKEFEQFCCRLLHHRGRRRWVGGGITIDPEETADEEEPFLDSDEENGE